MGGMGNGTYALGQVVEVMETVIIAGEGRHVLGPRGEDEQGACSTGFEAFQLWLPVSADGDRLHLYEPKPLFQC